MTDEKEPDKEAHTGAYMFIAFLTGTMFGLWQASLTAGCFMFLAILWLMDWVEQLAKGRA